MTTAAYVRISDSKGSDVSPERQRAAIAEFCEREGLPVPQVTCQDLDMSGSTDARPGWRALLVYVRDGIVNTVVAYDQDRLFRDEEQAARFIKLVRQHAVRVGFVTSGWLDVHSADAHTMFSMRATMDAHYSRKISERTKLAMRHLRRTGRKTGGTEPYGWRAVLHGDVKVLVPDEQEQSVIRTLAELRLAGASYQQLVEWLERASVQTKTGKLRWTQKTVRKILEGALKRTS